MGLIDLLPTLLELLELPAPAGPPLPGRSLASALAGGPEGEAPALYAESLVPLLQFGWSDLRVLRRGRYKYIQAPRPELYDLASDPQERANLLALGRPPVARELREELGALLDAERARSTGDAAPAAVSEELLQRLGALGYLGGTAPADTPTPGADPKDKIADFRFASDRMRRGLAALHAGEADRAAALLEEIFDRGIESAELHLYLGQAHHRAGRPARAVPHFRQATERVAAYPGAWTGLATALVESGDPAGALDALARGREALPQAASLAVEAGRLLRLLGRSGTALEALEDAVRLAPEDAFVHAALGETRRDLGDLPGAIASFRRATELAPEDAAYANALAMTLGGSGRLEEAVPVFRRAVELEPENPRYAYNLGLALHRLGRTAEARPLFERVLELDPTFAPARQWLAELHPNR